MNEKWKMFKDDFALDFANDDQLSYTDTGASIYPCFLMANLSVKYSSTQTVRTKVANIYV